MFNAHHPLPQPAGLRGPAHGGMPASGEFQGGFVMPTRDNPGTIDDYIARFAPDVQAILQKIRRTVAAAAPDAEETISYRMPAFRLNGILIHFAAFKNHIGLYPPVRGDDDLMRAVKSYAGPKGNLQFSFEKPIPYTLIGRIVRGRVLKTSEKAGSKKRLR
jgi:uncharacterized protein YdhG (YjbR/CyaY superfamily)